MAFQIGDTVGDYQIIGLLGAGGMGKVYKVKNQISDRVDALKVLLPDLANDPELADRFIREIKVLASLNHANIAGLRTAFRLDNQLLMVMEFVEGTTLDDRAKAGPIPLADSINYIAQALAGLGYAHKHGVIHRDIKPANMMLTTEGIIKLMDFGIAKSKSDKKLTQTGTTMGSLFYMSAEQVQGAELDGRSDLYSMGVSLYELVTGIRPFSGKSDFDIMVAQLQQAPMPPMEVQPGLPKALNDIILISLEKEPAKRFQTAEAFAAALGTISNALQGAPLQASAGAGATGGTYTMPPAPMAAPLAPSVTGMMGTPGTAATPIPPPPPMPAAMGGTVATPIPRIPTAYMPTVMAPQPPAPAVFPPPPPMPATAVMPPPPPMAVPAAQPASGSKGYRGLYMTLGALIALAVIVLGATQLPRILKTHAAGDRAAPAAVTSNGVSTPGATVGDSTAVTTDSSSQTPATVSTATAPDTSQASGAFGAAGGGAGAIPAAAPSAPAAGAPPPAPAAVRSVNQAAGAPRISASARVKESPVSMAAGAPQVSPGAAPAQAAPAPAPNQAANAQAMAELTDLHDKLSIRAQSVNAGVDNMRKQMAAGGNNLRGDISASQTRMRMNMDKFDAAMNANDPAAARHYMNLAEHEVETLEKFLGQ